MNEWFVLCWSNVRSQAMGRGQRTQQQPASDGEGTDLILSEDRDHLGVGGEVLLVLGVLELLGLDVGPEPLDHLGSGELLALLGADEVSQLGGQLQGLGE